MPLNPPSLIKVFEPTPNTLILSNSLIFYGNQGIGKSTFSYKLINTVFSSLNENSDLTNQENLIYNNSHPNLIVIHKELSEKKGVSRNFIIIEQIRKLESYIYQSSFNNMPKFIIIDSADDLNINSANAILKILEEPKENTYFILISHQLSKLLPKPSFWDPFLISFWVPFFPKQLEP